MSPDLSAILMLLAVVAAGAGGYVFSLWLHPERDCPRCAGQGKHRGSVFTGSRRQCTRCGGTGRQPRLGTVVWERLFNGKSSRFRSP